MSDHLAERAAHYRVHFLGRDGKPFATDEWRAASDDDAVLRARLGAEANGFELWREDRLIHREDKPDASSQGGAFSRTSRARR